MIALSPISPLSPASASAADVWSAPDDLSDRDQITTLPQVSSDSDGNAVAVWLRATVNDTTDPTLCDTTTLDKCVVEAVAVQPDDRDLERRRSRCRRRPRTPPQADVVINGSGEAMAIWRRTSGAGTHHPGQRCSTARRGQPVVDLSVDHRQPAWPAGVGQPHRRLHRRLVSQLNGVDQHHSSRGSSTARHVGPLPTDLAAVSASENAELSRVVADGDGNVIAVWQGQRSVAGPFFVRASRLTAGVWSAPVSASRSPYPSTSRPMPGHAAPQLASMRAGNATAVWHQSDGTNTVIRASRYNVGTALWSAPQTLSAAGGNALNPRVESDAAGNVTALWRRFDAPRRRVTRSSRPLASRSPPALWGPVVDLSTSGRQSQSQRLAVDAAGNVTAVWRRNNADPATRSSSRRASHRRPVCGALLATCPLPVSAPLSPSTDVDATATSSSCGPQQRHLRSSRPAVHCRGIPGFVVGRAGPRVRHPSGREPQRVARRRQDQGRRHLHD